MKQANQILDIDEILSKKDFFKDLLTKGAGLVRASNNLPTHDELKYYMNNEQLKAKQRQINARILNQLKRVAQFAQVNDNIELSHFSSVIEITDQLLENVDSSLDKMKKINFGTIQSNLVIESANKQHNVSGVLNNLDSAEDLITLSQKEKPQLQFKNCIDNTYEYPFYPIIKEKPFQQLPLDDVIIQVQSEGAEKFFEKMENPLEYEFPHPFAFEIENLNFSDEEEVVQSTQPSSLKGGLVLVENQETFDEMIAQLSKAKEIAIDLEHHSMRSFNGITCLIQISDRVTDYIVDVFKLWNQIYKLNIVTSNPSIRKVLHGAEMDVQWLQRDFGVYLVNMFDTGTAARILSMPSYSLAFLLSSIAKAQTDKKYQLADWRVRPIPKEMLSYARCDTHYLLFIYDELRIQLQERAKRDSKAIQYYVEQVFIKSKQTCLKKYNKPLLEDDKYHSILQNQRIILSDRKFKVLKQLLQWRFIHASKYDESPSFVLPNDQMFQIVQKLPLTVKEFLASFLKLSYVAQIHAQDIVNIISQETQGFNKLQNDDLNQKIEDESNMSSQQIGKLKTEEEIEMEKHKIEEEEEQIRIQMEIECKIEQDDIAFKIDYYDVRLDKFEGSLGVLEGHQISQSTSDNDSETTLKLEKIEKSFEYADPVDFFIDKYPFMREAYDLARQQEEELIKKRDHLTYVTQVQQNQSDLIQGEVQTLEKDEYMAFIKEKGPSSQPKQIDQIEVPELPLSYEDQFKTNLKKRKYNFGNNSSQAEQDGTKKGPASSNKSTFDLLFEQEFRQDNEDDEEEGEIEEGQVKNQARTPSEEAKMKKKQEKMQEKQREKKEEEDYDALTNKIKNLINKDPKFKSGINQNNKNNNNRSFGKNNHNKGTSKFINKFKKNGF